MRTFYLNLVKTILEQREAEQDDYKRAQMIQACASLFENEEAFDNIVSTTNIGEDNYYLIKTKVRLNDYESSHKLD